MLRGVMTRVLIPKRPVLLTSLTDSLTRSTVGCERVAFEGEVPTAFWSVAGLEATGTVKVWCLCNKLKGNTCQKIVALILTAI